MAFRQPIPPERRAAAEALLRDGDLSLPAIAAQTGVSVSSVWRWDMEGAIRARRAARDDVLSAPSLDELDAMLRAHVGRAIARLDAELRATSRHRTDFAKALRDLTGLRRLLVDLRREDPDGASQDDGGADGESPQDLAALRADIARRYAAFEAAQPDGAVPGEPAAPLGAGAGA